MRFPPVPPRAPGAERLPNRSPTWRASVHSLPRRGALTEICSRPWSPAASGARTAHRGVCSPRRLLSVYPHAGPGASGGRRIADVLSYCFRHDPSKPGAVQRPVRKTSGRRSERVQAGATCVRAGPGTPECSDRPKAKSHDPFFGRGESARADPARHGAQFEIVVPIASVDRPRTLSLNYHDTSPGLRHHHVAGLIRTPLCSVRHERIPLAMFPPRLNRRLGRARHAALGVMLALKTLIRRVVPQSPCGERVCGIELLRGSLTECARNGFERWPACRSRRPTSKGTRTFFISRCRTHQLYGSTCSSDIWGPLLPHVEEHSVLGAVNRETELFLPTGGVSGITKRARQDFLAIQCSMPRASGGIFHNAGTSTVRRVLRGTLASSAGCLLRESPSSARGSPAIGEVDLASLLEALLLERIHDREGHLLDVLGHQPLAVLERNQRPVDPEHRGQPRLEMDVRSAALERDLEDLVELHAVPSVLPAPVPESSRASSTGFAHLLSRACRKWRGALPTGGLGEPSRLRFPPSPVETAGGRIAAAIPGEGGERARL